MSRLLFIARFICLITFGSLFGLAGCNPGRGDLTGKVLYQGKTVCSGGVQVVGSDGLVYSSKIEPDGTYSIKGVPAGAVKVALSSPDPGTEERKNRKGEVIAPAPDRSKWFAIPGEYAEFDSTPLTVQVKPGTNNHDLELK